MGSQHKADYPFPQRNPNHTSFGVLKAWWEDLRDDRGERAVLRRAANLTEVMLSPAYHRLLGELREAGYGIAEHRYPKLAAIAGLVARVKEPTEEGLAASMGTPTGPESTKPAVAELRMRRILACNDVEELYTLLRRGVALLKERASLPDLAAIIWHWAPMDEKRPNDPRRQMAHDYYTAAPL